MSPITDVHLYYVLAGVLHRRAGFDPNPLWNPGPGQLRPDTPGSSQGGLGGAGSPSLTTLTAGDITMFDTGFQFVSGASSGTAVPGQTGTGTSSNRYTLTNVKIDGRVKDSSVKYGQLIQSEVVPSARATGDTGLVSTNNATVPHSPDMFIVSQCDLHCALTDFYTNGIMGHGWSSYRNHIWNTVDGLHTYPWSGFTNAYVSTTGDWIEYQNWVAGSNGNPGGNTQHPVDGSHSDAFQIEGGKHIHCLGTFFSSKFDNTSTGGVTKGLRLNVTDDTSAGNAHQYYGTLEGSNVVQITQLAGRPGGDITFDWCWFDGGYNQTINFSPNGGGGYVDGTDYLGCRIANCTWGRRWGKTAGYWVATDPAGPSKSLLINTPAGSTLADRIDFGNGAGGPAGTNTYWPVGDALDGLHIPVFKNSNTVYRLA